ncbi:hypothetical protein PC116_g34669 [Phytophthora cactorum]|nr:hypothetical protein PC116_g34669 [Phytophthora cactorum]
MIARSSCTSRAEVCIGSSASGRVVISKLSPDQRLSMPTSVRLYNDGYRAGK